MKKRSWISGLLLLAILAGGCAAEPVKTEMKEDPFPSRWETASEPLTTEKEPLPLPVIDGPEIVRVWANSGETSAVFDLAGYASADGGEPVSVRGEYDPNTAGDYPLFFTAENAEGGVVEKPFTLRVLALPYDENGALVDGEYETLKGYSMVVKDSIAYVEGYLIANKTYPLPSTYLPGGLLPEAEKAYREMYAAAPIEFRGRLIIDSGYRSWWDQFVIFRGYVSRDGQEKAETYSARPGHSEHQSGLAMDLVCSDSQLAPQPGYKEPLDWLNENAWKYGFIKRYPQGKTDETGYIFESWHYRYVGKDLAAVLYNGGDWITMEDYFGFDSDYKAPYGS